MVVFVVVAVGLVFDAILELVVPVVCAVPQEAAAGLPAEVP